MPADEQYRRQVALLIRTLPHVAQEKCFALKGGTAINLFIRDMPRLSVDIDLMYLPVVDREKSLDGIQTALYRIEERITRSLPLARVQRGVLQDEGTVNKLFIRERDTQIKIEVTPVLRGCVYVPEEKAVSDVVEEQFGFAVIQVVSFADLYAGKLVAALDRQHPRDLFDVRELLANEGIDTRLRNVFIVYLISHRRPMAEVLAPSDRSEDISKEFARGFVGMAEVPISFEDLLQTREELFTEMIGRMPDAHRRFLLSFKKGYPDWSLLDVPHAKTLPAVRWKLENLSRMDPQQREKSITRLEEVLKQKN